MAHQPSSLARAEWAVPLVNSTAERDQLFPNPVANQRVQNLQTSQFERWVGGWVADFQFPVTKPPYIVHGEDKGLSSSNTGAQNTAALAAAYAALPTGTAAILELPAGTFLIDVSTPHQGGLNIMRSYLTVRGQGMGKTILQYDSSSTDGTYGRGSCIVLNMDEPSNPGIFARFYSNINIEDITFQDLRMTATAWVGHIPSAIDGIQIISFGCRRCEFIDCKANACITVLGDAANPTTPGTGDHIIEDCLFRGSNPATPSAGTVIQRDCINNSAMRRIFIRRNRASGFGYGSAGGGDGGHFFEGGAGIGEAYVEDNTIDFGGIGMAGVGAVTVNWQMRIAGNTFRNWSNNSSPVDLIPDNDSFPQNNIVVENNRFICDGTTAPSSQAAVYLGGNVGSNLLIQGNLFECVTPIVMGRIPGGVTRIAGNTWQWTGSTGNAFVQQGGSNPGFANATDILEIAHNNLRGSLAGGFFYVVVFSSWPALKDRRVRGLHSNSLQTPYTSGQIDGVTVGQRPAGAAVAQGADSAIITTTVVGAIVGDSVRFFPRYDGYNIPPAGVTFAGAVTAADTVSWYLHNNSGAAVGASAEIDCMMMVERT